MTAYRVTFKDGKIGRSRGNEPVTVEARNREELAARVLKHASKSLASRFPDVEWTQDGEPVTGWISAGFYTVAEWTAERVDK